ncbi:alkaline shock response membrane anchor protein AmaP [Chlamydiota bacterium]
MRFLRGLFLTVILLFNLAIGAFLFLFGIGIIDMDTVLTLITDIPTFVYGQLWVSSAGIGLIIMVFCVVLIRKKRMIDKNKYISFDNPEGQVLISVSAIENFICKVGKTFSQIKDIYPKVLASSGKVLIKANVVLWSGGNIPTFSEELQKELRSQVQDVLGIENVQKIDLTISEISEKKGSSKKSQHDESEEPAAIPYR